MCIGGNEMRNWLKELRVENNLTQKELANMINVATTTYASYEQGWRNPPVEKAKKIAIVLDFDWTIFLMDTTRYV